jgi:hypothetical protein
MLKAANRRKFSQGYKLALLGWAISEPIWAGEPLKVETKWMMKNPSMQCKSRKTKKEWEYIRL